MTTLTPTQAAGLRSQIITTDQRHDIIGLLAGHERMLASAIKFHDWRAALAAAQECAKLAADLMVAEQEGQ